MKEKIKKIAECLKLIFGYGIMITLFAGGLTFFGYLAAIIIGGNTAAVICNFIYEKVFLVIIYISSALVLLGLFAMYLSGERTLTATNKKKRK